MADEDSGVTGEDEVAGFLMNLGRQQEHTAQLLKRFADEIVIPLAQSRTPVLTGALRDSAHSEEPVISGDVISVTIKQGGDSAPYGVRVHEDLGMYHPRGGQAKFLESAVIESAEKLGEAVQVSMEEEWKL